MDAIIDERITELKTIPIGNLDLDTTSPLSRDYLNRVKFPQLIFTKIDSNASTILFIDSILLLITMVEGMYGRMGDSATGV
ncbi:MAG: hypothetical protein CMB48_02870 [Euryarchaeota archaeon]|nr:hypothetical protein [Euryarchaeota archaeon]